MPAHVETKASRSVPPADTLSSEDCGVQRNTTPLGGQTKVCVLRQSRISGRRDLNPRPVAAATVLQIQLGKFVAASARLEIELPSHGFGSSREAFVLYEKPRDSVARGFGMTGIMPIYSIVKVLT